MVAAAFCLLQDSPETTGSLVRLPPECLARTRQSGHTPLIRQLETQIVFVRRVKMTTIAGSTP